MTEWEAIHYGDQNDLGKLAHRLHGPNATYEVGHKGGISIYVWGHRRAFYSDANDMRTAIASRTASRKITR